MDVPGNLRVDVEDQQRRGDREDAVSERLEPAGAHPASLGAGPVGRAYRLCAIHALLIVLLALDCAQLLVAVAALVRGRRSHRAGAPSPRATRPPRRALAVGSSSSACRSCLPLGVMPERRRLHGNRPRDHRVPACPADARPSRGRALRPAACLTTRRRLRLRHRLPRLRLRTSRRSRRRPSLTLDPSGRSRTGGRPGPAEAGGTTASA